MQVKITIYCVEFVYFDHCEVMVDPTAVLQIPIAQSPEATYFRTGLPTQRGR